MPTYEYVCDSCGYEFEEFQSMTAEPLKECPKCGKEIRRKIGGGAGLVFKGSGFYITDYKNKKTSPPATTSKPAADKKADKKAS